MSGCALSSQTPVEDVPLAIAPFQGRVLVGVGKLLRIYDMGKKKLLRKCENKVGVLLSGHGPVPPERNGSDITADGGPRRKTGD